MILPLISTLAQPIRQWHLHRKTLRTLESLDDRALRDIGVPRSDIAAAAEAATRSARPPYDAYGSAASPSIGRLLMLSRRTAAARW